MNDREIRKQVHENNQHLAKIRDTELEIIGMVKTFAADHPHIDSPLNQLARKLVALESDNNAAGAATKGDKEPDHYVDFLALAESKDPLPEPYASIEIIDESAEISENQWQDLLEHHTKPKIAGGLCQCLLMAGDGEDHLITALTNHHPQCTIWHDAGSIFNVIPKDQFWKNFEKLAEDVCTRKNWMQPSGWHQLKDRLEIFERYIHTNSCSDEGGWFAFFTPSGVVDDLPDWRVNGYETEAEAVESLSHRAVNHLEALPEAEKELAAAKRVLLDFVDNFPVTVNPRQTAIKSNAYQALGWTETLSGWKDPRNDQEIRSDGRDIDTGKMSEDVVKIFVPPAAMPKNFQTRVDEWMLQCFGEEISADKEERCFRFLEESLELVQSAGCTAEDAHKLVDYVFGRPVGEMVQEIGGVMVTLAAFCNTFSQSIIGSQEAELSRVWTKIDQIREKQAKKPQRSPLPVPEVEMTSIICPLCDGKGSDECWNQCHRCYGSGRIDVEKKPEQFQIEMAEDPTEINPDVCQGCDGTGWTDDFDRCGKCNPLGSKPMPSFDPRDAGQ